jgi:hypothetical protein
MKKFIKKTLSIKFTNDLFLDIKKTISYSNKLQKKYKNAKPYPYIVIDNFLPNNLANHILNIFPPKKKINIEKMTLADIFSDNQTLIMVIAPLRNYLIF